jgi:hypothetical protein
LGIFAKLQNELRVKISMKTRLEDEPSLPELSLAVCGDRMDALCPDEEEISRWQ